MAKRVGGLLLSLAMTLGLLGVGLGVAQAENDSTPSGETGVQCTQIWQYQVTTSGDMTNAESGGSVVGSANPGDLFNVRSGGSPRYFGFNTRNGIWGWILSSKLIYTGNTWCG